MGKIGAHEAYTVGNGRNMLGLQPGLVKAEYPMGQTLLLAATFIKKFLDVLGDVPPEFYSAGWVHSTDTNWWGKMAGFALAEF